VPKGILVGTDLTRRSEHAFARGHALASAAGCRLALVHVVDADVEPALREDETRDARLQMASLAERFGPPLAEALVTTGDAYEAILATAAERGDDLVVLGASRPRRLLESFTGTTVERVIRAGDLPVLMARRAPEGPYSRILVATDLSEASAGAVRAAASLGLLGTARVTLAHVFQPISDRLAGYGGLRMEDLAREKSAEEARLRAELTNFIAGLGEVQVHFRKVLIEGVAAASLVDFAKREQADLIVLGTRGLSGIRRFVLGSVAAAVLAEAPCDVLAVPPAG